MRRIAVSDTERFDINRISNWTLQASGGANVDLRVIKRKLVAYVDADENLVGGVAGEEYSPEPISEPMIPSNPDVNFRPIVQPAKAKTTETPSANKPKSSGLKIPPDIDETRGKVLEIVAEFTGYPQEFIEMDADMEGELGIDSIKQAEIMSDIRAEFNLEVDEEFQIRDHPTLGHVASYVSGFNGGESTLSRDPGAHNKNGPHDLPEIHRHRVEIENMAPLAMGHLPSQILITRDQRGVADALSAKLQSLGVSSIFVDEGGNEEIRNVDTALIHLAPLDAEGTLASDPDPIGMGHIDTFALERLRYQSRPSISNICDGFCIGRCPRFLRRGSELSGCRGTRSRNELWQRAPKCDNQGSRFESRITR